MNEHSEVAKNLGASGIGLPQFNAQRCNQVPRKTNVVVHPLTPTPQLEVPRGWKSSHTTPESAGEARPGEAAY